MARNTHSDRLVSNRTTKDGKTNASIVTRFVCSIVGAIVFALLVPHIYDALTDFLTLEPLNGLARLLLIMSSALLGVGVGFVISNTVARLVRYVLLFVTRSMDNVTVGQVSCAIVTLVVCVLLAALISAPFLFYLEKRVWGIASAILCVLSAALGFRFGLRRWGEILSFIRTDRVKPRLDARKPTSVSMMDKILDTNVIIDGRILDILTTGFVEGVVIVPQFVLAELRHIADSQDPLRRSRGRRGLDILNRMQGAIDMPFVIDDDLMDSPDEVDVRLLRLAQMRGAAIVTNDFNLNKVAAVTGVRVLNINDLANALKPVLVSGEERAVQIVKEGREPGQGVGYLDDGTMIVVDNAKRLVGETVDVVVTNILQTAAGRMIFGRTKNPVVSRSSMAHEDVGL